MIQGCTIEREGSLAFILLLLLQFCSAPVDDGGTGNPNAIDLSNALVYNCTVASANDAICLSPIDSSAGRLIPLPAGIDLVASFSRPALAANGSMVSYDCRDSVTGDFFLCVTPADGSGARILPFPPGVVFPNFVSGVALSNDGTTAVFHCFTPTIAFCIAPTDGSTGSVLPLPAGVDSVAVGSSVSAISGDGSLVANPCGLTPIPAGGTQVCVSPTDGSPGSILPLPAGIVVASSGLVIDMSDDGSIVAYPCFDGVPTRMICISPTDGSPGSFLPLAAGATETGDSVFLSADGSVAGHSCLIVGVDFACLSATDGTSSTSLPHPPTVVSAYTRQVAFSPDGLTAFYGCTSTVEVICASPTDGFPGTTLPLPAGVTSAFFSGPSKVSN